MSNEKKIHGRIDCPCCGKVDGVRITADKNSQPFGFCDANCGLQLRIGGDAFRVSEFYNKHKAIAASMSGAPVSETEKQTKKQTENEKPKAAFDLGL